MSDETRQHEGLHSPGGTALEAIEPTRRWTPGRIVLQSIGFVVSIGLLVWAASRAFGAENRESVDRLLDAPLWAVGVFVLLTAGGIALNGLMFWLTLRPLGGRVPAIDMIATNALCTFLAILPFKLGAVARVLIHKRRDGIHFKRIVPWFAAMTALAVAAMLPLAAASAWRGQIDALWWLLGVGGGVACVALGVWLSRIAERVKALRWMSVGAYEVTRDARTGALVTLCRWGDVATLAGRFLLAAWIVQTPMGVGDAVLQATLFFLISVAAPAGTLGMREAGVAGLALAQSKDGADIALVALTITAAELVTSGVLGVLAAWRLRVDRVLLSRRRV
ncbi:MAG: lysylphosphatidylglycerol synthase domain-containing protein [Planctomycetota bacterium]